MDLKQKLKKFLYKYEPVIALLFVIGYLITFGAIVLIKYFHYGYEAMDLGIINNVFYNSSQGNFFASSIHPPTYLGDHFSPILFLLLPFYKLWPQPTFLILLQTLTLALCAQPIYLIAKNKLGSGWGFLFAFLWLFNPFVQNINLFEVSFLPFATLAIFWTFYFYQKNQFTLFILAMALGLMCREDVALVMVVFSILALFDRKKIKWIICPFIFGVFYFIFAIKISSYYSLSGSYKFLLYYSWLGNSLDEMIKNLLLHPWLILPKIFSPGSLILFTALLLPSAYVALFKPRYLLLSALIFIQLVSGVYWMFLGMILYTQYSALLLPGIFIAWIFGTKAITDVNYHPPKYLNYLFLEKKLTLVIVIAAVAYSGFGFGPLPGLAQELFKPSDKQEIAAYNELINKIPKQSSVAASYKFLAPLSSRKEVYSFNYVFLNKQQFLLKDYALPSSTEYIIIDFQDIFSYKIQYGLNKAFAKEYDLAVENWTKNLSGFGLIFANSQGAILKRGEGDQIDLVKIYQEMPDIKIKKQASINASIDFLGFDSVNNQLKLFWKINSPLATDYQQHLTCERDNKIVYEKYQLFNYGLLNKNDTLNQIYVQSNHWLKIISLQPYYPCRLFIQIEKIEVGQLTITPWRSTRIKIDKTQSVGPKIDLGEINL